MKWLISISIMLMFVIILSGCGQSTVEVHAPTATSVEMLQFSATPTSVKEVELPTVSPIPATKLPTETPTATPAPASPTPLPATATPQNASASICSTGCDFTTIQTALDHHDTLDDAVLEVRDTIHMEAGIVVDRDVTIRGLGSEQTIVQAAEDLEQAPDRVFLIKRGTSVTLSNMTIRHGKPTVEDECGGGILNFGTLIVDKSAITDNIANGGAGICNSGALTVKNSSIHHNIAHEKAPPNMECGSGGGIKSGGESLIMINTTVHNNQTASGNLGRNRGGGVHVGCACTATISNSTISNNKAGAEGGGIYVAGSLSMVNVTISNNVAKGVGGGIIVLGRLKYQNTIIAKNRGKAGNCVLGSPASTDRKGEIEVNSNNLVSDGTCSSDYSGDPLLDSLSNNDGDTLTQALLPGSPAIDAVPLIDCILQTDQRGEPRAVISTSADTLCDIGAFEAQNH
ncbi:choice-of-anchor Q domain-containing protein [Chloroflexota bacterium]